jgi:hypothetical protein
VCSHGSLQQCGCAGAGAYAALSSAGHHTCCVPGCLPRPVVLGKCGIGVQPIRCITVHENARKHWTDLQAPVCPLRNVGWNRRPFEEWGAHAVFSGHDHVSAVAAGPKQLWL